MAKILRAIKRFLGYCLSFILLAIGGVGLGMGDSLALALVFICFGLFILYKLNRKPKKKLKLKWDAKTGNEELDQLNQEVFTKALDDFNAIEAERRELKDKQLNQQIVKMQGVAARFLRYLQEHPEKVGMARRFVDYYQDRALAFLRKFKELEKTGLTTPEVEEVKRHIKEVLDSFDEAYEEQFSKVLNAQIMDLDAELKVMKQSMEADGIHEEETVSQLNQGKPQQPALNLWNNILEEILNEKKK